MQTNHIHVHDGSDCDQILQEAATASNDKNHANQMSFIGSNGKDIYPRYVFLDGVAKCPSAQEIAHITRERMRISPNHIIADIGSGHCPDIKQINNAMKGKGEVFCFDQNKDFLELAIRSAKEKGVFIGLKTIFGDAACLKGIEDSTMDATRAIRLLQWLPDDEPVSALEEMGRITKTGHPIVIADTNFSSLGLISGQDGTPIENQFVSDLMALHQTKHMSAGTLIDPWMQKAGIPVATIDKVTLTTSSFKRFDILVGFGRKRKGALEKGIRDEKAYTKQTQEIEKGFEDGSLQGTCDFYIVTGMAP